MISRIFQQLAKYWITKSDFSPIPSTYLGLPLGAKHKDAIVWKGAWEQFECISDWTQQYLSFGELVEDSHLSIVCWMVVQPT